MRFRGHVAVLACVLAVAACTGGGAAKGGAGGTATTAKPVGDPVALLKSVDLADSDTLLALNDAAADPGLEAAAEKALAAGATGDLKWAATWVVVNGAKDAAPLVPLATDPDLTIRVMAGTGLVARGRTEGFAPLVAALTEDALLVGHYPPQPAWLEATLALVRWTGVADNGPPFDADAAQRAVAQQRWQAWLDQHHDALHFDDDEGRWLIS
jgi:hypothetical protein